MTKQKEILNMSIAEKKAQYQKDFDQAKQHLQNLQVEMQNTATKMVRLRGAYAALDELEKEQQSESAVDTTKEEPEDGNGNGEKDSA